MRLWCALAGLVSAVEYREIEPSQQNAAIQEFVQTFTASVTQMPKYLSVCQIASPLALWSGFAAGLG
tara:strand:+ start:272 stop:472 length:201 start_codon:yes stop_codon:yes gene_type:complete